MANTPPLSPAQVTLLDDVFRAERIRRAKEAAESDRSASGVVQAAEAAEGVAS